MQQQTTVFHPIDPETWDRRQYFYYFTKMLPTGYSMTVEIDITNTYNRIKEQGKRFFPAYLYVVTRLINERPHFRIAEQDGQLGYYALVHPSYTVLHQDDKTMSNLWTEYRESFPDFYQSYLEDQERYAENHGIMAKPQMPPPNSYMAGMLPWVSFTSYSPLPFAPLPYVPVVQAGRYFIRDNRRMMPFSISVHHAVADGYHVGEFLEAFAAAMANPDDWMK